MSPDQIPDSVQADDELVQALTRKPDAEGRVLTSTSIAREFVRIARSLGWGHLREQHYDGRDMAEAYLAGYMSAEAAWTDGSEPSVQFVEHIADEFGDWLGDYDAEVYPAQNDGSGAVEALG